MIPFTQKFDPQTEPDLEQKLKDEAPGILAWAVRGAREWYKTGLGTPPASVMAAGREYQEQEDPLAEWLNENCLLGDGFQVSAPRVFENYQKWAEDVRLNRKETLSRTMFGRIMTDRFDKKRGQIAGKQETVYYGLSLRNSTNV